MGGYRYNWVQEANGRHSARRNAKKVKTSSCPQRATASPPLWDGHPGDAGTHEGQGERAPKGGSRNGRAALRRLARPLAVSLDFVMTEEQKQHQFTEVYLTEKQAAAKLNLSPKGLQAWRLRGGGPDFVRISCRCVRYRESVIDAWAMARECKSTSDPGPAEQPPRRARRVK